MLIDDFNRAYQSDLIQAVDLFYEQRQPSGVVRFLIRFLLAIKILSPTGLARRQEQRRNQCLQNEQNFARTVLQALQEWPQQPFIYWDIDDTLTHGTTLRPVAPQLLRFLHQAGYRQGVFSNNLFAVAQISKARGPLSPLLPFLCRDALHYNPPPQIGVKLGDTPLTDMEALKIDRFLSRFSSGVLIDNSPHAARLHDQQRGICVERFQPRL